MWDRAAIAIREGESGEEAALLSVLDAAALQTDLVDLREALRTGTVLVATRRGDAASNVVLGVLVARAAEQAATREVASNRGVMITAIAVRPGLRGRGIGTALVEALWDTHDRIEARFDPAVRPFWESLGFETTVLAESGQERGENEWGMPEGDRTRGESARLEGTFTCANAGDGGG